MKQDVKISVIIPVYNAENYLFRAVNSVLAQSLSQIELVLVDDGSYDSSGFICDQYSQLDARVKVVHKENGGVASARQAGMNVAIGEYFIHADSDDWLEHNELKELYDYAISNKADMVICDYYVNYSHKQVYKKQLPISMIPDSIIDQFFNGLHGSLGNKLIRMSIVKNNDVHFIDKINYCEDLLFNIQVLKYAKIITYLPNAYYHYSQDTNINSLTSHYNNNWLSDYLLYQKTLNSIADSINKPWIKQQLVVDLLSKLIQQNCTSADEYQHARSQLYSWDNVSIGIPMKLLIKIANLGYLSLAHKIYSILKSIKNLL